MRGSEAFIDTNVFLYALSDRLVEQAKAERARELFPFVQFFNRVLVRINFTVPKRWHHLAVIREEGGYVLALVRQATN